MPKGVMVVRTAPAAGREQEFNDWYDGVHMTDVLKLAGFTSARRFRKMGEDAHPYLALYEIEADDLNAALAALGAGVASGEIALSDSMAMDPLPTMDVFEQISELTA